MKLLNFRYILSTTFKEWGRRRCCHKKGGIVDCGPNLDDRGICAKDPCDLEKCYPQPQIVIIGAGMAGLSAAARLVQRGITNFIILEAYERPGGRVQSCWLGDTVVELGANWKPDLTAPHPVYKMSSTEDPPRPGVPANEHPHGLLNRVVPGEMDYPLTMIAYQKFRQIEQEAAQIFCLGGTKQQGSLLNFMSLRIQQEIHDFPTDQQYDAARIMFGLVHMINARCGTDMSMLCSDDFGCYMNLPGGEVRIPLGLIGVLAPMLCQIPEGAIRYCQPVNCIYWGTSQKNGHRVIVSTSDGNEYPADYVIVTVSLGVLRCNSVKMFCPALPASKIDAMRCIYYGSCNKVFLEYSRPFWFWHKGSVHFKFCNNELADRSDFTRGLIAIEPVPNSKHVLCAWLVGDSAGIMEGESDRDVVESLTEVMRLYSGNYCLPYPKTVLRSNWTSDPYFCGAYSFDAECATGDSQRALACPLPGPTEPMPPMLLFAGEATVPGHYATLGGARLSGIREAERIVQLTLQFQGPPSVSIDGRKQSVCVKDQKKENKDNKGKKAKKAKG